MYNTIIKESGYGPIPYFGDPYRSSLSSGDSNTVRGGQINTFQGLLAALMARGLKLKDTVGEVGTFSKDKITDLYKYLKENSGQTGYEGLLELFSKNNPDFMATTQKAKKGIVGGAKSLVERGKEALPAGSIPAAQQAKQVAVQGAQDAIKGTQGVIDRSRKRNPDNWAAVEQAQKDVAAGVGNAAAGAKGLAERGTSFVKDRLGAFLNVK